MKDRQIQIISLLLIIILGLAGALLVQDLKRNPSVTGNQNENAVNTPKETTLFFAGDIMLSRNVAGRMISSNDYTYPFRNIAEKVKEYNIAFANLESPFSQEGPYFVEGTLVFNADPKAVQGLNLSGFDILSTANNHGFDQGREGLLYTNALLNQNNILPVGTGLDCHDGVIKEVNGIKFGFLGYSYTAYNDGGKSKDPLVCDWNDREQVALDIQALKTKTDFVIVSSHMGAEYKRTPEETNANGARAAIDAGADLFIGHHPHWMQTIEEYKGKYIFYSLGNFVFDQMWSQDTREGLAVEVLFKDQNLSRITLMPVVIDNYCCPRWATDQETKTILSKINPQYISNTLVENGFTASDWRAATAVQLDNTSSVD